MLAEIKAKKEMVLKVEEDKKKKYEATLAKARQQV